MKIKINFSETKMIREDAFEERIAIMCEDRPPKQADIDIANSEAAYAVKKYLDSQGSQS